jgi:hypothetical protein
MGFLDLEAPADAKVVLTVRGQDTAGTEHRFDQVFHAAWSSAWMEPAALWAGPQADLFAFTAEWLAKGGITPAPDTTTLDGRRVFFNAFSAEGFTMPSALPGFRLCAEVVRERILSRYFLPFTVAVCEADLRGWRPGQKPEDAPHFEQLARAIFDMPHVAAASYSFSQPTQWTQEDKINGPLNEHAKTNRFDMEREVAGSMSYIHSALLPAGKSVSLMLWLATGAPGSEALDYCARIGVQSLTPAPSRSAGDSAVIAMPTANEVTANSWMHGENVEVFATAASRADARPTLDQQLATLQAADGQHLPALRALQRIATENLAEADLRHIATLGEILDDTSTALQARQMIVERQEKPSVADLMAIAALTPQHDDPALAQTALAAAAKKAPQIKLVGEWLQNSCLGTACTFSTAVEQVKPAIEVPQEE